MEASSSSTFARFDDPAVPLPLLGEINGCKDGRADFIKDREVDFLSSILDIDDPFSNCWKECTICLVSQRGSAFPQETPTPECQHGIEVCTECLKFYISSAMAQKGWDRIDCPTCVQHLEYSDVKASAARDTFDK